MDRRSAGQLQVDPHRQGQRIFPVDAEVTPGSLTSFTASPLDLRRTFRLSMENSGSVETPRLGVHETGGSSGLHLVAWR